MIDLWPLLLPAAAWSGWWLAERNLKEKSSKEANNCLSHEYIVGLNFLLNEQADKAVDIFIKLLDVDSETVETHLALGSLFRRRGEVERAIRIHQNLIARPQLSVIERKEALMALGQDYMSAGVFDRAERIFLEVLALGGAKETRGLYGLLAIYEQEKSWEKALDIVKKIEISSNQSMRIQAAHYYCELAEHALMQHAYENAKHFVSQALSIDKQSVRASLIQSSLYMTLGLPKKAIDALRRIPEQDSDFIGEIIDSLRRCYHELDNMSECINFLQATVEEHPRASTIFAIADYLRDEKGMHVAIDFMAEKLGTYPSIRGVNRLIFWHLETAQGKVRDKLQMLYDITSKFLDNKPIYRCIHCGFCGKHLHWHCPSCKQWSKMKPVHGLEGD